MIYQPVERWRTFLLRLLLLFFKRCSGNYSTCIRQTPVRNSSSLLFQGLCSCEFRGSTLKPSTSDTQGCCILHWQLLSHDIRNPVGSSSGTPLDLYSEGARFEFQPRHRLSWLKYLGVSPRNSNRMSGQSLKKATITSLQIISSSFHFLKHKVPLSFLRKL